MYGTVECYGGGVCRICGGIGDENPAPCPPAERVEYVTEWRGWPPTLCTHTRLREAVRS